MQVTDWHRPQAELADIKLIFEGEAENTICWGQEQQLITMVTNLVQNALNYTKEGAVIVRTWTDEEDIHIEVEDTGMGIAEEELDLIFNRFYRGENVGQLTIPGSGIGLALTREIVEMHQGYIKVSSKLDEGTIFYVTIPRADKINQL